jgi:hypothetical protein
LHSYILVLENFFYIDSTFMKYPKTVVDLDTLADFQPEHKNVKLAERLQFEISENVSTVYTLIKPPGDLFFNPPRRGGIY